MSSELKSEYKHGFVTSVETETIRKGLDEDIVRMISAKKNEPEWLLEYRLKAYRHWLTMAEPHWARRFRADIHIQPSPATQEHDRMHVLRLRARSGREW